MPNPIPWAMGPSPRVRGSQDRRETAGARPRSIPACAGEPYEDPPVPG